MAAEPGTVQFSIGRVIEDRDPAPLASSLSSTR